MLKKVTKLIEYIFPTDKVKTPQDHAEAILYVLSKFEPNIQSDILASLKKSMIEDRLSTINKLTKDLEKLKKI